jgi:hypothetical protein
MDKDLLLRLCVRFEQKELLEQVERSKRGLRITKDVQKWAQITSTNETITTANDALCFIFIHLLANPDYRSYMASKTPPEKLNRFLCVLGPATDTLLLGWAPDGQRAKTPEDKQFKRVTDFVTIMCERYRRM